jgi:3-phenylpropionate/cinnamic acid dioxygenase small subunit
MAATEATTLLVARSRIERVLIRYASALDGRDWPSLRSCFTEDATVSYRGTVLQGVDEVVDHCSAALERYVATHHQLSNIVVEVDGDRARSVCSIRAEHLIDDATGRRIYVVVGRYVDDLEQRHGSWLLTTRTLEGVWDWEHVSR